VLASYQSLLDLEHRCSGSCLSPKVLARLSPAPLLSGGAGISLTLLQNPGTIAAFTENTLKGMYHFPGCFLDLWPPPLPHGVLRLFAARLIWFLLPCPFKAVSVVPAA
jgi:hypothetical protein